MTDRIALTLEQATGKPRYEVVKKEDQNVS